MCDEQLAHTELKGGGGEGCNARGITVAETCRPVRANLTVIVFILHTFRSASTSYPNATRVSSGKCPKQFTYACRDYERDIVVVAVMVDLL
jgi:hypothetical protein